MNEEMFDWLNANCRGDIVEEIQELVDGHRIQLERIKELEHGLIEILEGCRSVKNDENIDKKVKDLATLVIKSCNLTLEKR
jgi:hypothetical protein